MSLSNKYCKLNNKLSSFYKMQNEIKKQYSNTVCTRASFYKKNGNSKYFFYPNFLILDSQIDIKNVLPKNSDNISRETSYDDKIVEINKELPQLEKAVGTLYACRNSGNLLTDFIASTISVFRYKDELIGITCLHVLGCYQSLEDVKLFINFGNNSFALNNIMESLLIDLGFTEVELYPNYLQKRQEFLKIIETGGAEELFHDNKSSMHPYPTFDILIIRLPDFLIKEKLQNKEFLEFDQNFGSESIVNTNKFCYFIGFHSDCDLTYEEYKNTPIEQIKAESLVFMNLRSITFGEIVKNVTNDTKSMIRATVINTFPLSSGSALLSEDNKVIGFLGLSFSDDQTLKGKENF